MASLPSTRFPPSFEWSRGYSHHRHTVRDILDDHSACANRHPTTNPYALAHRCIEPDPRHRTDRCRTGDDGAGCHVHPILDDAIMPNDPGCVYDASKPQPRKGADNGTRSDDVGVSQVR